MNASEDGAETMGEAPPELPVQRQQDLQGFVHQVMPLNVAGERRTVQVPAQTTQCPHLVIAPAVGASAEGHGLRFRGALALTHTQTGALLIESTHVGGLETLAGTLKDFDWDFSELDHFVKAENCEKASAVREVIRQWQVDEGFTGSVALWGDDEAKRDAREREPATTLLREQLDGWPAQFKSVHDGNLINTNPDAWREAISCSVNGWGMAYLLAVLQRVDPQVADIAARRLVAEFDAGDGLGEWVFQWRRELEAGKPLTLPGIPDADPLAEFGVSA